MSVSYTGTRMSQNYDVEGADHLCTPTGFERKFKQKLQGVGSTGRRLFEKGSVILLNA